MYKCAILGCGPRARAHAEAYEHIEGGTLAAICDADETRLRTFGEQFGVTARYTNLDEMLEKERPDLLHIVTPPQLRVGLLRTADAHGVPAVVIEKPIALEGEDYRELCAFAEKATTKVCVNHQLHFHPRCLELQRDVLDGRIGEVRFIDASARLGLSGQGTHVLELVDAFNGAAEPVSVFAQASGTDGFRSNHPAPDRSIAAIEFANGVRAQLACGLNAPPIDSNPAGHMHKRIAVYGTKGLVQWTMSWFERAANGTFEKGFHTYRAEDVLGQAGLVEAAFKWLDDEAQVHPTNLSRSLVQFNIILGLYTSVIHRTPVALPVDPEPNLIDRLERALMD